MSIRKSSRIARPVVKAVRRSPRLAGIAVFEPVPRNTLEELKEVMRAEVAARAEAAVARLPNRLQPNIIEQAKEEARAEIAARTEAAIQRLPELVPEPPEPEPTFEELVGDYHYSDDQTQMVKDIELRKLFIEKRVFKPCIHAEFGEYHYAGILVAVHPDIIEQSWSGYPVPAHLRMVGPRLYNINGSLEGYLTRDGIWWEE